MVELREYFSESNAIENVHSESAIEETLEAWEFLDGRKSLTHTVVQTAHEYIMQNRQPNIAGEYRNIQVSVGGRMPPPPVIVKSEMDKLLSWVPAEPLEALEWHIAFEHIHPFADGNGRVGRLIYLWQCTELGAEPVFWRAEDRDGYYDLFDTTIDLDARITSTDSFRSS